MAKTHQAFKDEVHYQTWEEGIEICTDAAIRFRQMGIKKLEAGTALAHRCVASCVAASRLVFLSLFALALSYFLSDS